ncbi:MAG: RluA family pseudouridine synthase [Acidimicrobiia bacterium]
MIAAEVTAALDGERIDRVVSMLAGCSRAVAAQLVAGGRVRVEGIAVAARSSRVVAGDRVEVDWEALPSLPTLDPDPSVPVTVVHEDADVVVVDKPAGLTVHPGAGNPAGTLVHGLLARYPDIDGVGTAGRPGIVHRLDKDTSGLLVVARTPVAYDSLTAQLAARSMGRCYQTLVWGHFSATTGAVDAPVGRSARTPTRMAVSSRGKEARTRYEVLSAFDGPAPTSLLRCQLETGRTHQIRVHLAAIDHPVVGDARYGGRRPALLDVARFFLHAESLDFDHPGTGQRLAFRSPLPPDLAGALILLR